MAFQERFNPLNQVYVFNYEKLRFYTLQQSFLRFNPLNQVYVFNDISKAKFCTYLYIRFNPLNQVYVFNVVLLQDIYFWILSRF